MTEVPVDRRTLAVPVLLEQGDPLRQVVREAVGGQRGVLPALEVVLPGARVARRDGQGRLPDAEELGLFSRVGDGEDRRAVGEAGHVVDQRLRALGDPRGVVVADLGHQPALALGHRGHRALVDALDALELDDDAVDALQEVRLVGQDRVDAARGRDDVAEPEHHQRRVPGLDDEVELGVQHRHQRRLGAHQRAGEVEARARHQVVEVVARHAARDVGEALGHQRGVVGGDRPQPPVDLRAPPALGLDGGVLLLGRRPHPHPQAVVGEHLEAADVVGDLAERLRGRPAGVVADHPAERAADVRRGLRAEDQAAGQGGVEVVELDAGLDDAGARVLVDRHDPRAVLRPVDHHGGVAALPGEARAAAAGEHRDVVLAAHGERLDAGVDRPGDDHADRDLAVVRGVDGVRGARPGVEAHLAVDPLGQRAFEALLGGPRARAGRGEIDRGHRTTLGATERPRKSSPS